MAVLPPAESTLPSTLDDATLEYIAAMRLPFDQLRQAAGQIAGVLVLAVAVRSGAAGHPMLELADTARRHAEDAVRDYRPPPCGAHHHHHLLRAANLIATALDAARLHLRADDAGTDVILAPLRAGFQHLQWAAAALPGFEVVAFSQGCCARHAPVPQRESIHIST